MAFTAFGAMQPEQKRAWVRESIRAYREKFFFKDFMGKDENNIIQLVTELKKTEKGDRAMIGLVADMDTNGVFGDNELKGREESLESDWIEIHTDQLRKGTKSKGRVDNQRSVFDFRREARDKLAYWRANIMEELIMLTASGITYALDTTGRIRVANGQDLPTELEFAADVAAPTANRHFRIGAAGSLHAGDTTAIANGHTPKYGTLVDLHAEARRRGLKPLRIAGMDCYVYLCDPRHFASLKKDGDFRDAVIHANERGMKHPVLTGATVTMDGLIIKTNNRVFNTSGAIAGSGGGDAGKLGYKWGANGAVEGTRSLLMGCQALGYADLWNTAMWYEGKDDHDNKDVISIAQYAGVIKPQFVSTRGGSREDFGVFAVDSAINPA